MKPSRPGGATHAKPATRLGRPSAWRLGPLPQAWRGWTPRLAVLTRLHGRWPPAPACGGLGGRRAKRGYLRWGQRRPVRFAPRPAWPSAAGWTPAPSALRASLSLRESPSQVAALRSAPGLRPPSPYRRLGPAAPLALRHGTRLPPTRIGRAGARANSGAAAGRLAPPNQLR